MSDKKSNDPPADDKKAREVPPEATSVTRHETCIDGKTLAYTATAARLHLKDDKGEPKAGLFYVALTLDGVEDASTRPITFCFNGGPGSSSVWLQLGALGPRRVDMPDTVNPKPPPYRLVDNAYGILDRTDLVFIDPVDTGFSRTGGENKSEDFFNVKADVEAVGEFIWRYISKNHRWNSPKFLAGESYGTTRAAALAKHLQEQGIVLNGLVMLSLALNFQTFVFEAGNELPYILYLPSYAAVAWYHDALDPRPPALEPFLTEVRRFALEEYAPALLKGSGLDPSVKASLAQRLATYTGLAAAEIERLDLRVDYLRFAKSVAAEPGYTVGRLDARYLGPDSDPDHRRMQRDPSMDAPMGPFAALINDYVRRELAFEAEDAYTVLSLTVNRGWKWDDAQRMGYVNVTEDLRHALLANPHLKVIIANGIYDLATPFFAAEYTADHLSVGADLRQNVSLTYYEAGHMMYFHPPSLAQLRADLAAFYDGAVTP